MSVSIINIKLYIFEAILFTSYFLSVISGKACLDDRTLLKNSFEDSKS